MAFCLTFLFLSACCKQRYRDCVSVNIQLLRLDDRNLDNWCRSILTDSSRFEIRVTIPPGALPSASDLSSTRRLLLVDDEPALLRALQRQLELRQFTVTACAGAAQALNAIADQQFDCAVLDFSLPGTTGIELMQWLRAIDPTLAVVLLSGTIDVPRTVNAIRSGAEDVQTKPHSIDLLQAALERGLERTYLARSRKLLASQFTDAYGVLDPSPAMQRAMHRIQHAARLELPLLLVGEVGTGKRAIAEMIHELSAQSANGFTAIGMRDRSPEEIGASIQSFLLAGRETARTGLGTLFLDDVDTIDSNAQRMLLNAFESKAPFRLIVSTRKDLLDDVKAGLLLAELHQRIASLPVAIPSLRERGADAISNLSLRILQRLRIENGEGPESFTQSGTDWLTSLHWPANVPQLRDVITESFARAAGEHTLDTHHLAPSLVSRGIQAGTANDDDDRWTLSATERRQILAVVGMTGNNRSQAARLLGITRTTLYKKLREYGIETEN